MLRAYMPWMSLIAVLTLLAAVPVRVMAGTDENRKAQEATEVLDEIMRIPEQSIPPSLLDRAQAIAVIPNVVKVGFIVAGRYGQGVLLERDAKTGRWSYPTFVTITGGSFGFQIGAQATDVVLVFRSRKSVDGIVNGKFTLGADASVAAGPVGRRAEAATDQYLKAEIYSYSRSRGLFAGVSLEGSALQIDDKANAAFYDKPGITAATILSSSNLKAPAEATALRQTLSKYAKAQ